MKTNCVRLQTIEISDFKNVGYGKIDLDVSVPGYPYTEKGVNLLGIYGQNGSGKTSVIEALIFLKSLMSGNNLPKDALNYVRAGQEKTTLAFQLYLRWNSVEYSIGYKFSVNKEGLIASEELTFKPLIEKGKHQCLLKYDETSGSVFLPKYRYEKISCGEKEKEVQIGIARGISQKENRSFIFSKEFHSLWKDQTDSDWMKIIEPLNRYAVTNLFIIEKLHSGFVSLNFALPVAFKFTENEKQSFGEMVIRLDEPTIFRTNSYELFTSILTGINQVLSAIVPQLTIEIKEHGTQLTPDGKEGIRFELLSKRGDTAIPLRYESEGIKKIISVLSLFISVYNDPSTCVAIDELDAGIYEYLLGELLSVFCETGKGQLIFASHNLRPLEVMDNAQLVFTTVNPFKRYIRLKNVKNTNNKRNLYLRSIDLGGQSEVIYERTDDFKIRNALNMAGRMLNE